MPERSPIGIVKMQSRGAKIMNEDHVAGRLAALLSLAAAPVFAMMALLTASHGGGSADLLCSAVNGASPLSGMAPMYALMAVFHSPPWLRLISRPRTHRATNI